MMRMIKKMDIPAAAQRNGKWEADVGRGESAFWGLRAERGNLESRKGQQIPETWRKWGEAE